MKQLAEEFRRYRQALALPYFGESPERQEAVKELVYAHFAHCCELSDTLLEEPCDT